MGQGYSYVVSCKQSQCHQDPNTSLLNFAVLDASERAKVLPQVPSPCPHDYDPWSNHNPTDRHLYAGPRHLIKRCFNFPLLQGMPPQQSWIILGPPSNFPKQTLSSYGRIWYWFLNIYIYIYIYTAQYISTLSIQRPLL